MIERERIPELVVPGKPLGRHKATDDRSAAYPAETAARLASVRHASSGLPLNQQETSSCTGNALAGALNCVPHWKAGQPVLTERDALAVYSDEEVALGFGPYPPNDNGGSGLDVCKAAKARGWLWGYQHATDLQHTLLALVPRPVIIGIDWFDSFDSPMSATSYVPGLIEIASGATVRGGHEVLLDEINVVQKLVGGFNSWGSDWGVGGRFCMTWDTLGMLLARGGDATVPRTRPGFVAQPLT